MTIQRYVNGELIEKEELRSIALNSNLSNQISKSIGDVRRKFKNKVGKSASPYYNKPSAR